MFGSIKALQTYCLNQRVKRKALDGHTFKLTQHTRAHLNMAVPVNLVFFVNGRKVSLQKLKIFVYNILKIGMPIC